MVRRFLSLFALLTAVTLSQAATQAKPDAPPPFNVREHYTKYEYSIPMRDGKKLFTSIYVPKDSSRSYPFLMDRTPYSVAPYGVDNYKTAIGPSESFEKSGYIFVYQDVRGAICRKAHLSRCGRISTIRRRTTTSMTAPTLMTPSTGC